MKKRYFSILLSLFLGLHLSSIDILAQSCTQLSLPENAIARLCRQEGGVAGDLDFSPDGKTLASVTVTGHPKRVVLWDIENKAAKLTINDINGRYVRYSPDGKTLVCGDKLYDAITGEPKLLLLDGEGYRDYVLFSPDGKILTGAGPKGIRFWKSNVDEPTTDALPVGERPINVLPTDPLTITTPKENPTSIPFATSSTTVPGITGLSYSPDGKELAIACSLGILIYDPELNEEVTLLNANIRSVAYSPDGKTLAGAWGGIYLWNAKTKKHKFRFYHARYVHPHPLAYSPDGEILISDDSKPGGQIDFWDPATGEYKYTLSASQHAINSAIFSPDGNTIASASGDSTILLWDFTSYPIVSISPDSVTSLTVGDELAFDVKITNSKNLSGYQATIEFDPDALEYIETKYGDFLSGGVPVQPIANQDSGTVQLASLSLSGDVSNGDGTLATIKFKVKAIRTSKLGLRDVLLSNPEGNKSYAWIEGAQLLKSVVTEDGESIICSTNISEDVNKDCVVNIQDLVLVATKFGHRGGIAEDVNGDGRVDIIDLVLVAGAFENTASAPAVYADAQEMLSSFNVQQWLHEARKINLKDPTFRRGILMLEQLTTALPKETALLPNYPNPFNPETWIPYQLAEPTSVTVSIYSADGTLIRTLGLGNQAAGLYQNRSRAAYWDGKNDSGESVASGIYFYTLIAGKFSATRKMLILK
ncbi:MAG: cohesin domain-containing protein [Candidatus Poribacteria bacterium]|nr:cohesin domain-containing protein [Candidatus Poribacteria bacterium]